MKPPVWILALLVSLAATGLLSPVAHAQTKRVSVVVFGLDAKMAAFERAAQARAEELLGDAGYEVLDEKKASSLKKNWVDLADPSHVVTAEEFAARAGQYDIQKVIRLSLTLSSKSVLGMFYTATANADVRLIDREAKVAAVTSDAMGTRGQPPSDGLTEGAALTNAVQRAVDSAFERAGIPVSAPVTAKVVPLSLEAVAGLDPAATIEAANAPPATAWTSAATMLHEKFRSEDPACVALSPDQQVGAYGGYTWSIDRLAGMSRTYGGRIHLIDVKGPSEFNVYVVHELGKRQAGENGTSAPLACAFVGNWRYLLVASGIKLSCYDVERGMETCSMPLPGSPKDVKISFARAANAAYVILNTDRGQQVFRLAVGGRAGAAAK